MIQSLTITQLAENAASSPGLLGEHGASFFIEADEHCLLLDTGQGLTLRHNAARLGIALERVTAVALSHGHYDHTGGLETVIECTGGAIDLYLHPEALAPKFNRDGRSIGSPITDLEALRPRVRRLIAGTGPVEIRSGIRLSGEIPRRHPIEDTGGPFYRDAARTEIDALPDDQALIIDTPAGLVVVLGCGHSGLINTLDHVRSRPDARSMRLWAERICCAPVASALTSLSAHSPDSGSTIWRPTTAPDWRPPACCAGASRISSTSPPQAPCIDSERPPDRFELKPSRRRFRHIRHAGEWLY